MDAVHKYQIRATSTMVRSGFVIAEGIDRPIPFSAPPEFKGVAGYWTPEHFFCRFVSWRDCYVSTFSGMAFNSNFEFSSLELETEGSQVQDDHGWRFRDVILRPRLTIAHSEKQSMANRLLHKAKDNCFSRGVPFSCPLVLEPRRNH